MHHNDNRPALLSKRRQPRFWLAARLAVAAWSCLSLPAWAALGDAETSVSQDAVAFKASLRVAPAANYRVHVLLTPEGTTIREYVSAASVIFAVSWQGPFKPSLRLLLGTYFDRYSSAPPATDSTRTHLKIELPDLVVRSSGHLRFFSGVALLPQSLPAGVTEGDLQ